MNRMSHRHARPIFRVLYTPFMNANTASRSICFGVAPHELFSRSYAPDSLLQSIPSAILMSSRTESSSGIFPSGFSGIAT